MVVLFGGEGSREGTLVYDPCDNSWTRQQPAREPGSRSGGNLAYDARRRLHVLFGSQFDDDRHTWGYDLRTNTWRDLAGESLPPTRENDAVLTYDEQGGRVVAIAKITEGKDEAARHRLETWAFDTGAQRWTKMNPPAEPDASGNRARVLSYAPELGLVVLENRPHPPQGVAEQQIWTYRLPPAQATTGPSIPEGLAVTTGPARITLTWRPAAKARRYAVYGGTGERAFPLAFKRIRTVDGTRFAERVPAGSLLRFYAVTALDAQGVESERSAPVRAQPRIVEDAVVSVLGARRVELAWKPSAEPDVVGYHVERAPVEVYTEDQLRRLKAQTEPLAEPSLGAIRRIGAFTRLTGAQPLRAPQFSDTSIDLEKPAAVTGAPLYDRSFANEQLDPAGQPYRFAVYAYRVRAVNRLGVESGPSAAVYTVPSSPQYLFSHEVATACRLKWSASPEKALRGYRVYRMNGRYDKDPIPRLTPAPLAATRFVDTAAGTPARRYYVVAVDVLGQEGFPSSPVWCNREWASFYQPFAGEWHQ